MSILKYITLPFRKLLNWYYERHPVTSFYDTCGKLPTEVLPPPIIVLNLKGGIGKTLSIVNTTLKLSEITKKKVTIWDVNVENPSLVRYLGMMGIENKMDVDTGKLLPVPYNNNGNKIEVHSMGTFLMDSPRRTLYMDGKTIQNQLIDMLFSTNWGKPDYFLIDAGPTLSDEFILINNVFDRIGGVLLVGTSEDQAVDGCERAINMCIQHGIPIIGLIENKSGEETSCCSDDFICKKCGKTQHLYDRGEIRKLARRYNKRFLGTIPFNPRINKNRKEGKHLIYNDYEVFEKTANVIIKEMSKDGDRKRRKVS